MCTLVPLTAALFGDQFAYNRAHLELHAVSHGNIRQILNLIDEVSAVARLKKA